jgi:hypothetical protein
VLRIQGSRRNEGSYPMATSVVEGTLTRGPEPWNSPSSSAEVSNACSSTSTPLMHLRDVFLRHGDNFACNLCVLR